MKSHSVILTAAALVASLHIAAAGDVTGKITLEGTPPPEKPLPLDPNCGKLHAGAKPTTTIYATDGKGGLADVFVQIIGAKGGAAPATPLVLDQVGCVYTPYVLGGQAGQKVIVKNSDPVMHNVHPTPTAAGNKEANKAQVQGAPPLEFVFEKPEPFLRFKCDVHPWMFSYIYLVDHPYFAVSGKDGTFKIANVPPGEYTIVAHHRRAGKSETKIKVDGSGGKADFKLSVPKE